MKLIFQYLLIAICLLGNLTGYTQVGIAIEKALEKEIPLVDFSVPEKSTETVSPIPTLSASFIPQVIPSAYNYDHLGWFCKMEVQLEKKIKLPMKVRLGEVQYTERLEYGEKLK